MSENQSGGSGSNSEQPAKKKRRSRRRPVKRNKNAAGKSDSKNESKSKGKSRSKERINERARSERRRRRRNASSKNAPKENKDTNGSAGATAMEIDYVAPESVFIYTHIARKDQRDAGYEFRPEHFTHTGRRPEDFQIDISSIVGTILDVEEGSKGILHDFVWDDDSDEETVFEKPEAEDAAAGDAANESKRKSA